MDDRVTFSANQNIRALLHEAAKAGTRTLSAQVLHYVKAGLRRDGLLPTSETPKEAA